MFEKLLKSIPRQLFSIKFLQQFLSTLVFFLFLNFQFSFIVLFYWFLSLASCMTSYIEYLANRMFNNNIIFLWYYMYVFCTQIWQNRRLLAHIWAQFKEH